MAWALPSALLAMLLKYLEDSGHITLDILDVLTQGDIYSGYTYVLGISLVFRTSQSYSRYWTACTSVHEMASEWSDSAASLVSFTTTSTAPAHEIIRFRHTLVRLFSLLHAMALTEIADVNVEMPIVDLEGLSKPEVALLASSAASGKTVQIILCWIKAYTVEMAEKGILNVPAPLLTRVFQEFGAGLVRFHTAQQVVIWPFPFPYTQLNVILIQVYTVMTPLVISTWETRAWVCAIFTFISVTCMVGLDLIASELENPFGEDPNDLPVVELQGDMNKFLVMLLNPAINRPPKLLHNAEFDFKSLALACTMNTTFPGLAKQKSEASVSRRDSIGVALQNTVCVSRADRLVQQLKWIGADPGSNENKTNVSIERRLKVTRAQIQEAHQPEQCEMNAFSERKSNYSCESRPPAGLPLGSCPSVSSATKRRPQAALGQFASTDSRHEPPLQPSDGASRQTSETEESGSHWAKCLHDLRRELTDHMETQLDVQRRELSAMETLLNRVGKLELPAEGSSQQSWPARPATLPTQTDTRLPGHSDAVQPSANPEAQKDARLPGCSDAAQPSATLEAQKAKAWDPGSNAQHSLL